MRVAVLGGGLQGACVAMELASAGVAVDLYDKGDRFLTQASAHNEGKIHLGYVYANDPSLATARTMLRGAVHFAPLMRRWIGNDLDGVPVSTPFYYVVHADSMLDVDVIGRHLAACHAIAIEESRAVPLDYFGEDYRVPPAAISRDERESLFDPGSVVAAYRTPEVGIDSEALAPRVRARLVADPGITCILQARVHAVAATAEPLTVEFDVGGDPGRETYDHVVNTLWEGRLAVDRSAGFEPERPWLYRLKYYVRMRAPRIARAVPSTTVVLGPFGDVVSYASGDLYLSWYPAGMRGTSTDVTPPEWPRALDGPESVRMRDLTLEALARIVPAVAGLSPDAVDAWTVKAGVIFAWGETDIDDVRSRLHERYAIGLRSRGRYHSVNTGKLTMAPWFGKLVADRILEIG
jgi:glycine/D-amino acid oxidase-like deaminating enzyme